MTTGHTHRVIHCKRGGLVHRLLTGPTIAVTNTERATHSPLVWGPIGNPRDSEAERWRLSPLGLLHALTGLTLEVHNDPATARSVIEQLDDVIDQALTDLNGHPVPAGDVVVIVGRAVRDAYLAAGGDPVHLTRKR